jgi:hypothetical protein
MHLSIDELALSVFWKLGLNDPLHLAPQQAQHYWQTLATQLQQAHRFEPLITTLASGLIEAELRVLLHPESQQDKSYTEAFSRWISVIDFVKQRKSHIANVIIRQIAHFVTKRAEHLQPALVFSQVRKKLYLWNATEQRAKSRQPLESWLADNPQYIDAIIDEIGQLLMGKELKMLLANQTEVANRQFAQHYWDSVIAHIKTHHNPYIVDDLTRRITIFLKTTQLAHPTMKPTTTRTLWCWHPLPTGEDNHPEFACQSQVLPNGFKIVAARVRGKKHKHDGSHCDDWFEITASGQWGIIAVADGAGSKLFSRVGAKVACQAAVQHLAEKLRTHTLQAREQWSVETFARNEWYQFKAPDIELAQTWLHEAMQAAYQAIEIALHARDQLKYYYKALGNRDLILSDLATTLLLALHTTVDVGNERYSFVLACQIGDGMSAAIYKNRPEVNLLGEVEKSGFGGETLFLTSTSQKLLKESLAIKTFPFFSPMRALMVMSDGVFDDFFPPQKGMLRLLGELILNGILPVSTTSHLPQDKLAMLKDKKSAYVTLTERITEKGPQPTAVGSVTAYSDLVDISLADLIARPSLLVAGISSDIADPNLSTEQRLQKWLDTYHVRGSFDDRTLVVLTNETLDGTTE